MAFILSRIVDGETANQIAQFLDEELALLEPGDRIRADLTVRDKPKELLVITPATKIDDIDAVETFSATYEWLLQFRSFCRPSGGFQVLKGFPSSSTPMIQSPASVTQR